MQHFHRIKGQRFQEARKRFLDVSLYIDTLLYSFLKEQKIIRAFEDVKSTLADGHMKETVSRAIDHMMLTFDETEVFVDAMRIIEDEYKCNRIVNAHEFMAHAEYYGGDIKESARILLRIRVHGSAGSAQYRGQTEDVSSDYPVSCDLCYH